MAGHSLEAFLALFLLFGFFDQLPFILRNIEYFVGNDANHRNIPTDELSASLETEGSR
jgi:hypothetical protein